MLNKTSSIQNYTLKCHCGLPFIYLQAWICCWCSFHDIGIFNHHLTWTHVTFRALNVSSTSTTIFAVSFELLRWYWSLIFVSRILILFSITLLSKSLEPKLWIMNIITGASSIPTSRLIIHMECRISFYSWNHNFEWANILRFILVDAYKNRWIRHIYQWRFVFHLKLRIFVNRTLAGSANN